MAGEDDVVGDVKTSFVSQESRFVFCSGPATIAIGDDDNVMRQDNIGW